MSKLLPALAAVLTLAAAAACDQPEPARDPPSGADAPPEAPPTEAAGAGAEQQAATPSAAPEPGGREETGNAAAFDPMNASFTLDGRPIVLANGVSRVAAAPGSASSVTTRYLGLETRGDLTRDGREDLAFLITRDGGSTGLFHHVVVAIEGPDGYRTTNAFPVGDRIEPQSLRIVSNELQVNFLGRGRSEPMTAPPSRPSVLLLKVTPAGVLEGLMK